MTVPQGSNLIYTQQFQRYPGIDQCQSKEKRNVNVLIQNILQLGVDIYLYLDADKLIAKMYRIFLCFHGIWRFCTHDTLFVGVTNSHCSWSEFLYILRYVKKKRETIYHFLMLVYLVCTVTFLTDFTLTGFHKLFSGVLVRVMGWSRAQIVRYGTA